MIRPLLIASLLSATSTMAQTSTRITITSLPAYHPAGSDLYAAGSFNGWNPKDTAYRFKMDKNGKYFIEVKLEDKPHEFKITRGGWDKTECKKAGATSPNRVVDPGKPLDIAIEEWSDRFASQPAKSTASKNVQVIDTAFLIPQLKRARRVWIYLPPDHKEKAYPVLYLHDGQNLFDDATSFSGEWGVDEFFDSVSKKCIVVGIDHGGGKRLNEYNPYDNERFGKGEGAHYADFLVNALKTFIDKRYKTLNSKENTFIGGSSMGGLISLYTMLRHPSAFGGGIIFSPAFWIGGKGIFDDIQNMGSKLNSKLYLYGGGAEGETMVPDIRKAEQLLKQVSPSTLTTIINPSAKHTEAAWRKEFPKAWEWLSGQ